MSASNIDLSKGLVHDWKHTVIHRIELPDGKIVDTEDSIKLIRSLMGDCYYLFVDSSIASEGERHLYNLDALGLI